MLSAKISNEDRKAIYRRDGFACALCDDNRQLQIHHYLHRSLGGTNTEMNLITLCSKCHALAHGVNLRGEGMPTPEDVELGIVEYLADLYAGYWNPRQKEGKRLIRNPYIK